MLRMRTIVFDMVTASSDCFRSAFLVPRCLETTKGKGQRAMQEARGELEIGVHVLRPSRLPRERGFKFRLIPRRRIPNLRSPRGNLRNGRYTREDREWADRGERWFLGNDRSFNYSTAPLELASSDTQEHNSSERVPGRFASFQIAHGNYIV